MHLAATLFYVHDPLCSWCWGFRPAYRQLRSALPAGLEFVSLLGGLAKDSEQPMPDAMQQQLQDTWRRIMQRLPGTEFNFDFWQNCQPRRSTYPACRAVLAARACEGGADERMILAIQEAYYLRAMNPSDTAVLVQLASELQLDTTAFANHLASQAIDHQLHQEIALARSIGGNSFPSLILQTGKDQHTHITIDYTDPQYMIESIQSLLAQTAE